MIHYIENEKLKIGVKEFGAELTSVISKESGYEYLWQGDESIWSGQSPILFPIIGRLYEDSYSLNGKEYSLQKHGFARRIPWELVKKENDSLTFLLRETDDTLACYPFKFELTVTFTLCGNKLSVEHKVLNKNDGTMYFSLGAHPAFNCSIGDRLVFDENETLDCLKIDLTNSLLIPETTPLLKNEREITITEDIFKEDALIFKGVKSPCICLATDTQSEKIRFSLGKAPYLGIWAKPGAPYVCIEPWCGLNDSIEKKNDFSEKEGINALGIDETFTFTWSAEFSE